MRGQGGEGASRARPGWHVFAAGVLGFGLLALWGCIDPGIPNENVSEAQLAYNACVDSYNDKFRDLPGNKAIVAGVVDGRYQCFWTWNEDSVGDAVDHAMANCRAKFPRCFLYATNQGHSRWAQAIANNGGRDPGNLGSGGNEGVGGGGNEGGGGGGNGPGRRACHVDPIANIDQGVPANTCSIRDLTRDQCAAVAGAFHFKPDSGSGFTECFFRPD